MSNGAVTRLVAVQGDIQLEPATAAAYLEMKAAARREGVNVEIPTPAGGYRSLYMQRDMHQRPWKYNLDPASNVQLAPVGYSTHGWGDRVDIIVGQAREWAIRNADRFGFVREFGDRDPGHFKFTGPTLTATTRPPAVEAVDDEGENETMMKPKVFERIGTPTREAMVVAPWIAGKTDLERGYRVIFDPVEILAAERMYARGANTADRVNRDGYIAVQVQARIDYAAWTAQRQPG